MLEILNLEYRPRQMNDSSIYQNEKEGEKGKDNDKKKGGSVKNRKLKKNNTIRNKYKQ